MVIVRCRYIGFIDILVFLGRLESCPCVPTVMSFFPRDLFLETRVTVKSNIWKVTPLPFPSVYISEVHQVDEFITWF
jgi:hypothetical protein